MSHPRLSRRVTVWGVLVLSFAMGPWGLFWDFGPRQLARAVYVALWTIAPAPFKGAEIPDRFLAH